MQGPVGYALAEREICELSTQGCPIELSWAAPGAERPTARAIIHPMSADDVTAVASSQYPPAPVVLRSANPYDLTLAELQELAGLLNGLGGDYHFDAGLEEVSGSGVDFEAVIELWLPTQEFLRDQGWSLVIGAISGWLLKRMSRSPKRPARVVMIDSDGTVVGVYRLEPGSDALIVVPRPENPRA